MDTPRELTTLERGIKVKISYDEFQRLKVSSGFLDRKNYPEPYELIAEENELGRYMMLRLFSEE